MEKLNSSRPWRHNTIGCLVMARSDYGEVFGGPPRHSAPFSLLLEDYYDIFSSAASASSIPLLDLPFADNFETERQVGIDYSDVFGKFCGGGVAASYEELFSEPKRSELPSSVGRTQHGVLSELQEKKVLKPSLNGYSDDASPEQFMSHHIMSQEPLNILSENIHEVKLGAIPGYSIDVDVIEPIHLMKNETVKSGTLKRTKWTLNGGQNTGAASYFSSTVNNSMVNLKSDKTHLKPNCVSLLNVSSDEKHHSRSSSYHSTSSADMPLDDDSYLRVSEISLQAKPVQGLPPLDLFKETKQQKAMLTDSRSDVEGSFLKPWVNNQQHFRSELTNTHKINESMNVIPHLHDAEMDPSSAAARSIAAVKEAMEQAQARIKSAKELRDRKSGKSHMKVGLPKTSKSKEDGTASEVEPKKCSNVIDASLLRKSNMVSECAFVGREKMKEGEKIALNHEEMEVQLHSYRKDQQMSKGNASKSSEVVFGIGEILGEWKRDKKYYELISNDRLLNTGKDIYIHGDENKGKTAFCSCEDKEKDTKGLQEAIEVEENQKSTEFSFCIEKLNKDNDLKDPSISCIVEVNKNLLDTNKDVFLLKHSTIELEDNQQLSDSREDNISSDEVRKPCSLLDSCLHKESEKSSQNPYLVFELGVDNRDCEERQLKVDDEVCRYVECKRKSNVSYLKEINDSCKEVEVPSETPLQAIFVKEDKIPEDLFTNNTTGQEEVAEELNYEIQIRTLKHQYSYDEFRCKVGKTDTATGKDEDDVLQTSKESHILVENELEQVIPDENGSENFKMQGKIRNSELEQILNSRKSTCDNFFNIKGSNEALTAVQEGEESIEGLMKEEVHNFDILESAEGTFGKRLSENITEIPISYKFVESDINLDSADKICELAEVEGSETLKVPLSRKEGSLLAAAQDANGDSHSKMDENYKPSSREEVKNKLNIVIEMDEEKETRIEVKNQDGLSEKGNIALEQTNYEARQKAVAEALRSAERIAVERATAEARQRALANARERAEKATEAEKTSREARLRAERAAVERATEEARKRAIEKALAEKASGGARERTPQFSSSNKGRMREEHGKAHVKATQHIKEDSEARYKSTSTIPQNTQSQTACSTNGHRDSDSSNIGRTESSMRYKVGQERQQQTVDRAANALCERKMRDIFAQQEQAERDRLAESLDALVRRWSIGKDGNLRSLLSTLQYILAPESGWQPISLADLLNVPAVKKAYRKATLCVHPDKLQQRGANIQQKYICEKVFDLLKEAWDKFNSEERAESWYFK